MKFNVSIALFGVLVCLCSIISIHSANAFTRGKHVGESCSDDENCGPFEICEVFDMNTNNEHRECRRRANITTSGCVDDNECAENEHCVIIGMFSDNPKHQCEPNKET